jgi:PKD repeat protein
MITKVYLLSILIVALIVNANAQTVNNRKYNVLFIGNSYTYVNSLPQITKDVAASVGDTLDTDSNTIGGYTFEMHLQNAVTLSKIEAGGWDYVVLQEQSQLPSFPIEQVDTEVFPYAKRLDSLVHAFSSCGRSMFYMTWGKEFGDTSNCASWPPVCTYDGMDSLLRLRYMMMADSNNAVVSPVGAVRHYIIEHYPSIALYVSDQSHPTEAGTYAAACTFYTAIFRKDPSLITYNFTLSDSDAAHIRLAAKLVAYDSMAYWHIGQYEPKAQATYTITGNSVSFTNISTNASTYSWSFGDGSTSTLANPTNNYSIAGIYTVTLVAINCGKSDTLQMIVNTYAAGISTTVTAVEGFIVFPNPAHDYISIQGTGIPAGPCSIRINNLLGETIVNVMQDVSKNNEITISSLSPGLYIISISTGEQVVCRNLFLKK